MDWDRGQRWIGRPMAPRGGSSGAPGGEYPLGERCRVTGRGRRDVARHRRLGGGGDDSVIGGVSRERAKDVLFVGTLAL
jgi:hypothetical protein